MVARSEPQSRQPATTMTSRSERRHLELFGPGYRPVRCPECGADAVPLFWPDASLDVYDCDNPRCAAIFSRGD
jgi:hypothetical protein